MIIEEAKIKLEKYLEFLKTYKRYFIIAGVILLVLIILIVVSLIFLKTIKAKKTEKKEVSEVKVKVEKIKKKDYTQKYSVMGTIKGVVENDLRFEIEGVLVKYHFKEGDKIKKGEPIASLDKKDALSKLEYVRNKYKSEQASYQSALQRLKVYEDLYNLKAISEAKLAEVKYEVESIKQRVNSVANELELAELNYKKTELLAPSDGVLAEIIIHPGEFVTPHDIIAKYVTLGDVKFEVEVPEKDINFISIGMQAEIQCDAYPGKKFIGTVTEISPIVREKTRTVVVRIRIPNDEGLLRSGMFAKGQILLKEMKDSFAVLKDSVISLGERQTKLLPILKPLPDKPNMGVVELRQITTGEEVDKYVIVTDGVYEGEYYVTETSGELYDGLVVEYLETMQ